MDKLTGPTNLFVWQMSSAPHLPTAGEYGPRDMWETGVLAIGATNPAIMALSAVLSARALTLESSILGVVGE
jgi:hypothetical protein